MLLRSTVEVAVGVVYLAGALFNLVYVRTHGEQFLGEFACGAWVAPYRTLIRQTVVPNAGLFALLLAAFEATLAAMILSRGEAVTAALMAGTAFTLLVIPASRGGGLATNIVLAIVQIVLVQQRFAGS
jgi:hypothetical protein